MVNRPTETGGKFYDKFYVHIPTSVARDSNFPFKEGEKLVVKINVAREELVISRAKKG